MQCLSVPVTLSMRRVRLSDRLPLNAIQVAVKRKVFMIWAEIPLVSLRLCFDRDFITWVSTLHLSSAEKKRMRRHVHAKFFIVPCQLSMYSTALLRQWLGILTYLEGGGGIIILQPFIVTAPLDKSRCDCGEQCYFQELPKWYHNFFLTSTGYGVWSNTLV